MTLADTAPTRGSRPGQCLAGLRNIGRAALGDLALLGVSSVSELAAAEADDLYLRLCGTTRQRHDPCVHDVFAAAVHQARTGEALDWWAFTPARKARQVQGTFPIVHNPWMLLKNPRPGRF